MENNHKNDLPTLHARNEDFSLRMKTKYIYHIFLIIVVIFLTLILTALVYDVTIQSIFSPLFQIPLYAKVVFVVTFLIFVTK